VFFMATLKSKITAIKAGKSLRVKRSNVFLDDRFAFSLDNAVILKNKLQVGQTLTEKEVESLAGADRYEGCLNAALLFLGYRPRSEAETRTRLQKHGYNDGEIDRVIERLKSLGLIDDTAFAEYWKTNRASFKPRGERALKSELRLKGVDPGTIAEAVAGIDEIANARRAGLAKARTLPVTDYQIFRQKLGGYLHRRGFDYGVISKIVKQLWAERTGESGPDIEETLP
jgi:regulatory protein